jgi:hypothetical protein
MIYIVDTRWYKRLSGRTPYKYYKGHKAKYYKGYKVNHKKSIGRRNSSHSNSSSKGNGNNGNGKQRSWKGKHNLLPLLKKDANCVSLLGPH